MNMPTSTYYAVLLALVLGVGCGKGAVSSEKAQSLNTEVIRQGYEEEIEKLRAENKILKDELAAAKRPFPNPVKPKAQVVQRPLPPGAISIDAKGRPTFSILNLEAAAVFYSGMHLEEIKRLYGKPFVFPGPFQNSPSASYTFHNDEAYPKNIYNPGTEKMEGRFVFYFHPNTLKCVAVSATLKVLKTPYGISVGWKSIAMGIQ